MALSGLPRYKLLEWMNQGRLKIAWILNQKGGRMPLIYGPSLWRLLDSLASEDVRKISAKTQRGQKNEASQ
jgi:hypothetical protein